MRIVNFALTFKGIYEYDNSIFDLLELPDGLSKNELINIILLRHGDCESYIQNANVLRIAIGSWSISNQYMFNGLLRTIKQEYNPIENYDRIESYSEILDSSENESEIKKENTKLTNKENNTTNIESIINQANVKTPNINEEEKRAAFNSDSYSPLNMKTTTGTERSEDTGNNLENTVTNNSVDSNRNNELEGDRENIKKYTKNNTGKIHGNIGVTTTQEMLKQERDIVMFNIYNIIADIFSENFILTIY